MRNTVVSNSRIKDPPGRLNEILAKLPEATRREDNMFLIFPLHEQVDIMTLRWAVQGELAQEHHLFGWDIISDRL